MDRCTGHCCKRFFLPLAPDEWERALAAKKDGATHWVTNDGACYGIPEDVETIAAMIVYLGPAVSAGPNEKAGYFYTCKNLLPSGDCGIYERRPWMCSAYPYGKPCTFKECTWDAAKPQKLEPVEAT